MNICKTERDSAKAKTGCRWRPVYLCALLIWAPLATAAPPVAVPAEQDVLYEIKGDIWRDSADGVVDKPTAGLLGRAETALRAFHQSGDPRRLGEAQILLNGVAKAQRGARYYELEARIAQSLHRFDDAMVAIDMALRQQPEAVALYLLKYSIALVRLDMDTARVACAAIPPMSSYASGCRYQLELHSADDAGAAKSFNELKQLLMSAVVDGDAVAPWLAVTLADAGERRALGDPVALWRLAVKLDDSDLYARSRLCDAALYAGDPEQAIEVSRGFDHIDTLALCHAEALDQSVDRVASGEAEERRLHRLKTYLAERFAEAEWRGEALHKRAQARYLLRIAERPEEALVLAEANWAEQKELPDWRLLEEARRAVGREGAP